MPIRDEMTIDERRKYVNLMCERYRKAKRKERSQLLSEMEQVSKLHRKHLIRLLNGESLQRKNRARKERLPRTGPHRANQVTKGVPMGRSPWDTSDPGHFETDLVHHGGESAAGEYGHTLQLIDVATGWSERVMLLGRGYQAMERAFKQVIERLPFPVKELHPDNGTEFFNYHLVRFWKERVTGVHLSRSRPYQKNDNRHVEQKNDTLVRQYFGELRLDTALAGSQQATRSMSACGSPPTCSSR